MRITIKQLQERIEELEKQVRELQARPIFVPVYPNPQIPVPNPTPFPQPYTIPTYPWGITICKSGNVDGSLCFNNSNSERVN